MLCKLVHLEEAAMNAHGTISLADRKTLGDEAVQRRYLLVTQALIDVFAQRLKTVVLFGSQARGEARLGQKVITISGW